jgi:uncharacterized protein (TIGR02266 family)
MGDDRSGKFGTGTGAAAPGSPPTPNAWGRPPRSPVAVAVRCRFPSIIDFVETQSVNISREGMYLKCDSPPAVGSRIEFEVSLDDGFVILQGTGNVVRVVLTGDRGMGMRFAELDERSRKLINRIVEVNLDEGKIPTVPFDFTQPAAGGPPAVPTRVRTATMMGIPSAPAPPATGPVAAAPPPPAAPAVKPIQFDDGKLRVVLSSATANFFSYNPLLNIRMGGFFIPVETEIPLGTTYKVEIVDAQNQPLIAGKGKVVARQELRIGIRLSDVDKEALTRLQGLVAKMATAK